MKVVRDVFFANVTGSQRDNHHLDLFLPDQYDEVNSGGRFSTLNDVDLDYVFNSDRDVGQQIQLRRPGETVHRTASRKDDGSSLDIDEILDDRSPTKSTARAPGVTGKKGAPLVIFVHGGGWRRGGREAWTHYLYFDVNFLVMLLTTLVGTYTNVGRALAKNGIACAVISYPLTEAGPVCLLAELLLSYLQSCIAVLLAGTPLLATVWFELGLPWSSAYTWLSSTQSSRAVLLKTLVLSVMLVTNLTTSFLLAFKRKEFKLGLYLVRTMWVLLATGCLLITIINEQKLMLFVIFTFVINQGIILRLRLSRCGGCYEDQTRVLARAVKWAKTMGQETGLFDTSRVYLMGHSAGGHLVSLTVLDNDILAKVGCSSKDIKGVVSLSGVYDLMCLQGPFLRPFYLLPTFGNSQTTWLRASPSHLIKQKTLKEDTPKFLLMTAENDLFLKQQSWQFFAFLQEAEVDCRHIEVMGTNHFTIVTSLMKKFTGNDKSVLNYIKHFVHN